MIYLVTVAAGSTADRSGWIKFATVQLGTSNGCRDHTVLPYATNAVRPACRSSLTGRVSRERTAACKTNGVRRVRQNRVVPTPVAGAKLPVATSIQPDRSAIKPAATVARRIRLRGERGISRKTIAQGMPECLRCTCMLVCAFLCALLHTRPRVQRAPGIPCSLRYRGRRFTQTSGRSRRENANAMFGNGKASATSSSVSRTARPGDPVRRDFRLYRCRLWNMGRPVPATRRLCRGSAVWLAEALAKAASRATTNREWLNENRPQPHIRCRTGLEPGRRGDSCHSHRYPS